MPDLPKIYVKTGCPWCREALEFLQHHNIACDIINVTESADAMREMVALSGQSKAPTMDWHGEVLADFGAAELEPFLKQREVI